MSWLNIGFVQKGGTQPFAFHAANGIAVSEKGFWNKLKKKFFANVCTCFTRFVTPVVCLTACSFPKCTSTRACLVRHDVEINSQKHADLSWQNVYTPFVDQKKIESLNRFVSFLTHYVVLHGSV